MTMVLLTIAIAGAPIPASAEPPHRMTDDRPSAVQPSSIDTFIAEAAARFRIPERWIRVVMQAESVGNRRAVSRAGAMGLMQIMPATWAELRARHGLGDDPFDSRDNIMAGAAYIRAMYDRFGAPGFLAAYNAGPERYAQHLATGRPLPRETRAYLRSLAPLIDTSFVSPSQGDERPNTSDWRDAPLFVGLQNRVDE
ncbi:lytic transglycosylase domain-containing protein [Pacificimonas sp. WHA3]|uniref:Lytic transglycosylase domain-containing protein n=2 Tax=Pacificimonas pallii TaxID=2827236 RepID=A0ABS6SC38_9SPHN|nr:lytic transglycosylase domain-containing protein [Pacificimonas pallii]